MADDTATTPDPLPALLLLVSDASVAVNNPKGKTSERKSPCSQATEKDNGQEEMLDLAYHWSKLKLSPPA